MICDQRDKNYRKELQKFWSEKYNWNEKSHKGFDSRFEQTDELSEQTCGTREHPKEERERGREMIGGNDCQNFFDTNPRRSQYEELSETHTKTCARNQGLKAASNSSSIRVSANFSAETLDARKQWDERKKLSTEESTSRKTPSKRRSTEKLRGVHCK